MPTTRASVQFMFVMSNMHAMNLDAMDLNLLRVLDALLSERQLTRAARRVGLSQPAMSHALARLREHLGDPLFVRTPRGLVPTARAAQLAAPLRTALTALEQAFAGAAAFDPTTARRTFTIATADYGSFVIIPRLVERLAREAPGVDLWVHNVASDPVEQLSLGDVDLVIGPRFGWRELSSIHTRQLYHERFVCLVRRDHPRVKRRLDLETWVSLPHMFIAPRGRPGGVVDEVLARAGRSRRVALAVPHFLVAPHVVATSDMVVTLGALMAEPFTRLLPLKLVEPPVTLPGFDVQLCWHERTVPQATRRRQSRRFVVQCPMIHALRHTLNAPHISTGCMARWPTSCVPAPPCNGGRCWTRPTFPTCRSIRPKNCCRIRIWPRWDSFLKLTTPARGKCTPCAHPLGTP